MVGGSGDHSERMSRTRHKPEQPTRGFGGDRGPGRKERLQREKTDRGESRRRDKKEETKGMLYDYDGD